VEKMEEYVSLEEKKHMINNFIKNLSYNRYNLEISLLAENAIDNPSQSNINSFNLQIEEIDDKILALKSELAELGE
jgi:hypothetical protein